MKTIIIIIAGGVAVALTIWGIGSIIMFLGFRD
jgi:hypothetical protein